VISGFRVGSYFGLPPSRYDQALDEIHSNAGWVPIPKRRGRRADELELHYDPSAIAWENLVRLKQIADRQNIPLVILLMPVAQDHFTSVAPSSFSIDMRRFCLDEGIDFFDMNQKPFVPEASEYDRDSLHLLSKGAERFSRRFVRFALAKVMNRIPLSDPNSSELSER
jgi:hypothetical protein